VPRSTTALDTSSTVAKNIRLGFRFFEFAFRVLTSTVHLMILQSVLIVLFSSILIIIVSMIKSGDNFYAFASTASNVGLSLNIGLI